MLTPNDDNVLDINLLVCLPKAELKTKTTPDSPRRWLFGAISQQTVPEFSGWLIIWCSIRFAGNVSSLGKNVMPPKFCAVCISQHVTQKIANYISLYKVEPPISMISPKKILVPPPQKELLSLDKSSKTTKYDHNFNDILSLKKWTLLSSADLQSKVVKASEPKFVFSALTRGGGYLKRTPRYMFLVS